MKAEMMFDKFVGSWAMCGVFIGDEKRWMRIVKKKKRKLESNKENDIICHHDLIGLSHATESSRYFCFFERI